MGRNAVATTARPLPPELHGFVTGPTFGRKSWKAVNPPEEVLWDFAGLTVTADAEGVMVLPFGTSPKMSRVGLAALRVLLALAEFTHEGMLAGLPGRTAAERAVILLAAEKKAK